MNNFYVGQRVRLVDSRFGLTTGRHGTVLSAPYAATYVGHTRPDIAAVRLWVRLEIDGFPSIKKPYWDCPVEWLEPVPEADLCDTTTWSQCAWKPKELTRA